MRSPMRIFLTGATGHVGSAVLQAFLRGGHDVTALVRGPRAAQRPLAPCARLIPGDLADPASYAPAAELCDVIVHTGFESTKRGPEIDRLAVEALLGAAIRRTATGQTACMVYTSDLWVLGNTAGRADEEALLRPTPLVGWRPEHERLALDAGCGTLLRTVIVRPGVVYGGARGVIANLLRTAANGLVRVVGDGRNHWACVHHQDLADLYVRAATTPDAAGIYHATDEADERVRDIVEAIARHARVPPDVRHVPIEEARAKMGPYADALALNQIVSSGRARALGWAPTRRSVTGNVARLAEDLRATSEAA